MMLRIVAFLVFSLISANQLWANSEPDIYTRPDTEKLTIQIAQGLSFISQKSRKDISQSLKNIDLGHFSLCHKYFTVRKQPLTEKNIENRVQDHISRRVPTAEKFIFLTLLIQKEMLMELHKVIYPEVDINDIVPLSRRVRKSRERIFNNYADIYYTRLVSLIHDISKLQKSIQPQNCDVTTTLEVALTKEKKEIESFVLKELKILEINALALQEYAR